MSFIQKIKDAVKSFFGFDNEDTILTSTGKLKVEDLRKMTKLEIDNYVEHEFDIFLDRRQTKENMIKELQTKIKKEKANG